MKNRKNSIAIVAMCLFCVGLIVNCTHKDQDLTPPTPPAGPSDHELVSLKTTTPPTIDGIIDASWDSAAKLVTKTQVPNPGNAMFVGYIGEQYPITLRSMYDATTIYFLAEVEDATKNVQVAPWYFNPTTKLWAQEPTARTFDVNGNLTREGWGEDKLAFLWNVDNSTLKFTEQTCYASCHLFTPYVDPTKPAGSNVIANNSGNHYTNGANEKIDMWWLKIGRDPIHGQFSDEYQDWAGGPAFGNLVGGNLNGRHQDDQVPNGTFSSTWPNKPNYSSNASGTGTSNNTQSLPMLKGGVTTNINVPKYIIPGRSDYYFISRADITGGIAKLVTAVDSMGILTLDDATTIDPNADVAFQRNDNSATGGDGAKVIPSYVSEGPLTNGRADMTCQVAYTGSKWIIEWKRLLKTPDVLKQDVDFSSLDDQPFGVAYFNKSNYQHGIKPNLVLKFKK